MTLLMGPGPASSGVPRGTMEISPGASWEDAVGLGEFITIFSAIRRMINPPAMVNEAIWMPKRYSTALPPAMAPRSRTSTVSEALKATASLAEFGNEAVRAR